MFQCPLIVRQLILMEDRFGEIVLSENLLEVVRLRMSYLAVSVLKHSHLPYPIARANLLIGNCFTGRRKLSAHSQLHNTACLDM